MQLRMQRNKIRKLKARPAKEGSQSGRVGRNYKDGSMGKGEKEEECVNIFIREELVFN